MAAPIFTEAEVARLMAMPKIVPWDDWQAKWPSRDGADHKVRVQVFPAQKSDVADHIDFLFEKEVAHVTREVFLTLTARLPGRRQAMCLYHVQRGSHRNPVGCPPKLVPRRTPHAHVYNPALVRAGGSGDWSGCASILDMPTGGAFRAVVDRLDRKMRGDLMIEFHSPDAEKMLFNV